MFIAFTFLNNSHRETLSRRSRARTEIYFQSTQKQSSSLSHLISYFTGILAEGITVEHILKRDTDNEKIELTKT